MLGQYQCSYTKNNSTVHHMFTKVNTASKLPAFFFFFKTPLGAKVKLTRTSQKESSKRCLRNYVTINAADISSYVMSSCFLTFHTFHTWRRQHE